LRAGVDFRLFFAMLTEDQLRRLAELRTDPGARRAIAALLEERKRLVAIVQRLSRQLHYVRARLKQAAAYLDGLVRKAHDLTREPWPRQLLCPRCGAPVTQVTTGLKAGGGHASFHVHPDGSKCEEPTSSRDRG
jgi:hypothetical protein